MTGFRLETVGSQFLSLRQRSLSLRQFFETIECRMPNFVQSRAGMLTSFVPRRGREEELQEPHFCSKVLLEAADALEVVVQIQGDLSVGGQI